MYKIFKGDKVLAAVHSPTWVKLQDNGCFALCGMVDAQGVVIGGLVYHILGKPNITGAETVSLVEVSETTYQLERDKQLKDEQLKNDIVGQEVANLKFANMKKDIIINTLGQELASIKLQLLQGGI